MSTFPGYPVESVEDEDGRMNENVGELASAVVGHRIVKVEDGPIRVQWATSPREGTIITLDNGKRVELADSYDCCAFTELKSFLLHADRIDHVITGIGTTGEFAKWHIYADMGDVLELDVDWSQGSGYYGYGFDIAVEEIP